MVGLLDDYVLAIGPKLRLALAATASRTRSLDARLLLARAALGDAATLDDVLAAARSGDRRALRRIRRRIDPWLLAAVAQTIALQEVLPEDRDDALALYDLIRQALGPAALNAANQALHAQLAFVHRGPDAARRLLREYRDIKDPARTALELDLRNPFVADRPEGPWLAGFRSLLPGPPLVLGEGLTAFDRVTTAPVDKVETPHRISVVVTAYRPDQGLIAAVRSIRAQSWSNVEIVIVDDGSGPEYDDVLARAAGLGDRIRLIRLAVNGGTYAARNAGLAACGGEFAAFQDPGDWSHPRRLEIQVRPLLDDRTLVATTSDGLAVTDDLRLTRPGVRSARFNPASLLFRRAVVLDRIGWFDRVRTAADAEYAGRMQAAFGARAVHHVESKPLALIRPDEASRSEVRPHWMHPARTAYSAAYLRHHRLIAAGRVPAHRDADGSDRPFPVPPHLLGANPDAGREFDVIVAADWRFMESTQRTAVDELRALSGAGLRVAILQVEQYRAVHLRRVPIAPDVQDLVNAGSVTQIALGECARAGLLIARQAATLQFTAGMRSRIRVGRAIVVADRAPARRDGTDRRYLPSTCSAAVRRLFAATPAWVAQDGGVRSVLRTVDAGLIVPERDLPTVMSPPGWIGARAGAAPGPAVAGVDLCDAANWPSEAAETLAVCRHLPEADVRVRLPDRLPDFPAVDLPRGWLGYAAEDVGARPFLHQLDFYLHFPPPAAAELYSRPALEAAAMGCVVVMPERFAAFYGDAAVYCDPSEVGPLVSRYKADPALFAEQSRRARLVAVNAHKSDRFAEWITGVTAASMAALPNM